LVDEIREHELRRLHGQAYLDWGGAALYSEKQIDQVSIDLKSNLMENPHSRCERVEMHAGPQSASRGGT